MNSTDEAILTFAEAFARLGDRKHSELYLEALATIVRMAKAEERHAAQLEQAGQDDDEEEPARVLPAGTAVLMH
ncbi:MAG: hypothetical protein EOO80_03175 [Oxalobacteraceae bacterium]|nr:MAG: hypothetical protein EOO80_03175 [Oxalobacteraceae bacterium]